MRDNIGLNSRQQKFVSLVATGEISVTEAYVQAGYGTKRDSGNAHKLRRSLDSWIVAEREKLGLAPIGEEAPEVDDADKAALIAEQRKLYALAISRGETGLAQKCLRAIERLLRKPASPGRPVTAKPTPPPAPPRVPSKWTMAELVDMLLTPEEEAEIQRQFPAEIEEQRQLWLQEKPNHYFEIMRGGHKRVLSDGSVLHDFDDTERKSKADLRAEASTTALTVGEVVKRL